MIFIICFEMVVCGLLDAKGQELRFDSKAACEQWLDAADYSTRAPWHFTNSNQVTGYGRRKFSCELLRARIR